jgi:hypothetical protein
MYVSAAFRTILLVKRVQSRRSRRHIAVHYPVLSVDKHDSNKKGHPDLTFAHEKNTELLAIEAVPLSSENTTLLGLSNVTRLRALEKMQFPVLSKVLFRMDYLSLEYGRLTNR